jgi:hypothetical protein
MSRDRLTDERLDERGAAQLRENVRLRKRLRAVDLGPTHVALHRPPRTVGGASVSCVERVGPLKRLSHVAPSTMALTAEWPATRRHPARASRGTRAAQRSSPKATHAVTAGLPLGSLISNASPKNVLVQIERRGSDGGARPDGQEQLVLQLLELLQDLLARAPGLKNGSVATTSVGSRSSDRAKSGYALGGALEEVTCVVVGPDARRSRAS